MNEWYMYLGWVLAGCLTAVFLALALVQRPPREQEQGKYTIVYKHDNSIYLLPVTLIDIDEAEHMLNLYEQGYNPDCIPELHIYQYDFVGLIRGHHRWIK